MNAASQAPLHVATPLLGLLLCDMCCFISGFFIVCSQPGNKSGVSRLWWWSCKHCCFLQDIIRSSYPVLLKTLTEACQNDYNCKAAAKQGAAGSAAMLLACACSQTVHAAAVLLYTLTTETEARLVVGKALAMTASPHQTSAVDQLFKLLTSSLPGQFFLLRLQICQANELQTL